MGQLEKKISRLKSKPKDFTWEELKTLLIRLGFILKSKGKTSGSRVSFVNEKKDIISLHRPHPKNIINIGTLKDVIQKLESFGFI